MLVAGLATVVLTLLAATALVNRRTRRQLTGEPGWRAAESLRHDGGGTREIAREQARQEGHTVRYLGEHGHAG